MRASLLLISESSVSSSCFREVRRSCSALRAVSMSRCVWAISASIVVSAQHTMKEERGGSVSPPLPLFFLKERCEFYALSGGGTEKSIAAHRPSGVEAIFSLLRGRSGTSGHCVGGLQRRFGGAAALHLPQK